MSQRKLGLKSKGIALIIILIGLLLPVSAAISPTASASGCGQRNYTAWLSYGTNKVNQFYVCGTGTFPVQVLEKNLIIRGNHRILLHQKYPYSGATACFYDHYGNIPEAWQLYGWETFPGDIQITTNTHSC